jgi:RNase P subunit RPR2
MTILGEREKVIRAARVKYGGLNITEAVEKYINDLPEEEKIPLFITSPEIHKLKELLKTKRPTCEDCGQELKIQQDVRNYTDRKKYETAWICPCGRIEYSDKTVKEWLEILRENRG